MKKKPEKYGAVFDNGYMFIFNVCQLLQLREDSREQNSGVFNQLCMQLTEYSTIGTNAVMNFNYAGTVAFKNYVESFL